MALLSPGAASTVISGGQVIIGSSASLTVTINVQVAVLALLSVAVQVTVVSPTSKTEAVGGSHACATPGQLSDAVGAG
jgi:hypothetical protein